MADPFSLMTGSLGLAGAVAKASISTALYIKKAIELRRDLNNIKRELDSIEELLKLLADDFQRVEPGEIPDEVATRLTKSIRSCGAVAKEIERLMIKYQSDGILRKTQWALWAKDDMDELQKQLEAEKQSLDLALAIMSNTFSKSIKSDTTKILDHTTEIQQRQTIISEKFESLQLDRGEIQDLLQKLDILISRHPDSPMVQQYRGRLVSFAESSSDGGGFPLDTRPVSPFTRPDPTDTKEALASQDLLIDLDGWSWHRPDPADNRSEIDSKPSLLRIRTSLTDFIAFEQRASGKAHRSTNHKRESVSSNSTSNLTPASSQGSRPVQTKLFGSPNSATSRERFSGASFPDITWNRNKGVASRARKQSDQAELESLNRQLLAVSAETTADEYEKLLLRGADPNSIPKPKMNLQVEASKSSFANYRCALINAIVARNLDCVRLLLAYGADPNLDDGSKGSSLFFAIIFGEEEIVETLLRARADVNGFEKMICWTARVDRFRDSPLDDAFFHKELHKFETPLLTHSPLATAIDFAARDWHPRRLAIIHSLLSYGADPSEEKHTGCHVGDEVNPYYHPRPLYLALRQFKSKKTEDGASPLLEVCHLLIEAGAAVNDLQTLYHGTSPWVTPVYTALTEGHKNALEHLVTKGGRIVLNEQNEKKTCRYDRNCRQAMFCRTLNFVIEDGREESYWLRPLVTNSYSFGSSLLRFTVSRFSTITTDPVVEEDPESARPRSRFSKDELITAVLQIRRAGASSYRKEGPSLPYLRERQPFYKAADKWTEGNLTAVELVKEIRLDQSIISRTELLQLVEEPLY